MRRGGRLSSHCEGSKDGGTVWSGSAAYEKGS